MKRKYKLTIEQKDGKRFFICKSEFEYKGKQLEGVYTMEVPSNFRKENITAEQKQIAMREVDESINKYKLEN